MHEAFFEIKTGKILEGHLPKKAEKIVAEWCKQHREQLMSNWDKAQDLEPLERIQGADYD